MLGEADIYRAIPVFGGFRSLTDASLYVPLPDDWTIGLADIVDSTRAIAEGRYKAVNMAGAAVIAAVTNALTDREFPFVFGGDGASFGVGPGDREKAGEALAATMRWVNDELGMTMRGAMVSVADIRHAGLDVRVARFAPSANVSYAMFAGGGLAWAEAQMKTGAFAIDPAAPGIAPDLSGLSCRFEPITTSRGTILTMLVVPGEAGTPAAFSAAMADLLGLIDGSPDMSRPVPSAPPSLRWPPQGVDYEAAVFRGGSPGWRRLKVLAYTLFVTTLIRFGIRAGGFDPAIYMRQVVENSDFRKFDDGLRMVLDCTPEFADALGRKLQDAAAAGQVRFGLHRQSAALMTCFTPSATRSNHVHFIDGAEGGYAAAAASLKAANRAVPKV